MKWGKKSGAGHQHHKETKASGHLFQLSDVFFPFSWMSRMKQEKQSSLRSDSSAANPKRIPALSSDHLCFDASDASRRRSTGGDDIRRKIAFGRERPHISRSARHFSLGEGELELELRPISVYRSWDQDSPPTPMKRAEVRGRGQRMRRKVRVRSPRGAARRMEEEGKGEWRSLESFAVVKSSSDPEKDFRESMVEMIKEEGMWRPEELERLLACYINLNADEHHVFIVNAFRQVWFELHPRWPAGGECRCCHGLL